MLRNSKTAYANSRIASIMSLAQGKTGFFWERVRKWLIPSALVGAFVGLSVTAFYYIVYYFLWKNMGRLTSPVMIVLTPAIGLLLSGIVLEYFTRNPRIHGTDEVVESFHSRGGLFDFKSFPGKVMASILTLGFGGSAGMEGPSIYIGGVIGSLAEKKLLPFGFSKEDIRTMMVAGSAAGISAIFKAPLTGIVFALEVPYMDDITREALIPSLIASVTSYFVLVSLLGSEALFRVSEIYSFTYQDLFLATILGLAVGLVARIFAVSFRGVHRACENSRLPLPLKTFLGGLVCGLAGLASFYHFREPAVLGIGYSTINRVTKGYYCLVDLVILLSLKWVATIATLGSGGAGGIFIPMIMLGAITGSLFKNLFQGHGGTLFPVVGMSAFLAAGYNTPLASATFLAETTGGTGYLIPGVLAAAISYTIAGRISVSPYQKWRRESRIDKILRLKARDIMTPNPILVPKNISLEEFLTNYVIEHKHKKFPVVDSKGVCGMIAVSDVRKKPKSEWSETKVCEVMKKTVVCVCSDDLLADIVKAMVENTTDRVLVLDSENRKKIVGIISSTDILRMEDIFDYWIRARHSGK